MSSANMKCHKAPAYSGLALWALSSTAKPPNNSQAQDSKFEGVKITTGKLKNTKDKNTVAVLKV